MPDDLQNYGMYDNYFAPSTGDIQSEAEIELRKLEERDRLIRGQELFIDLYERQRSELNKIEDAERAYFGDSWPEEVKAYRQSQGLPMNKINMLLPQVQILSGASRQNRRDLRVLPVERDDEKKADLYGIILKYFAKVNFDWYYELEAFIQCVVCRRAHQEFYWDYSDDPFGELKCVSRSAGEVLRDIDAKDPNSLFGDQSKRIHMEWVTPRELERRYKRKDIDWARLNFDMYDRAGRRRKPIIGGVDDHYDFPSDYNENLFWNKTRNWVRILRVWQKDIKTSYRLLDLNPDLNDPEDVWIGDYDTKRELEKKRLNSAIGGRDIRFMATMEVQTPYWSYHAFSGRTELDWKPDIGRFNPWIDFYAIILNGQVAGLWDIIEDRQQWINYITSKLTERVGRSGTPTVWREDSFADDINPSIAIRDGQPIVVRGDVWDKLNGQPPFYEVQDRSVQYIAPLLNWVESIKNDIKIESNVGDVQSGSAPGSVSAASALAILQQEAKKGTSGYEQNMLFSRAQKARLRLRMLADQYEKTPTLISYKLDRIFGSVALQEGDERTRKVVLQKMANGGIDYDALMNSIKTLKYDLQIEESAETIMEQQQILQALRMAAAFGVQPSKAAVINALPIPGSLKTELRRGVQEHEQKLQQQGVTPELQEAMEEDLKGKAKDGNLEQSGLSLPAPLQGAVGMAQM